MPSPVSPFDGQASLRERALVALCEVDPAAKVEAAHGLWSALDTLADDAARAHALRTDAMLAPGSAALPGRPVQPRLVPPIDVPHRSSFTPDGPAPLLLAVCNLELNPINNATNAME